MQHPEDQELLPGVKEAIARYAADGWTMAIASNQGGCMTRECKAIDFPVGAYWLREPGGWIDLAPAKVLGKRVEEDGIVSLHTKSVAAPKSGWFKPDTLVRFQYKTLEDAIAEMRYCMGLTGIKRSLFCPDDGSIAISVERKGDNFSMAGFGNSYQAFLDAQQKGWTGKGKIDCWTNAALTFLSRCPDEICNYRKPAPGMLLELISDGFPIDDRELAECLFVGDRAEDEAAAQAAVVQFMWADAWRGQ